MKWSRKRRRMPPVKFSMASRHGVDRDTPASGRRRHPHLLPSRPVAYAAEIFAVDAAASLPDDDPFSLRGGKSAARNPTASG